MLFSLDLTAAAAEVDYEVGSAVNPKDGTVYAEVVIVGLAPGSEGVVIVVGLACAVLAAHEILGVIGTEALVFHQPFDAELHGGADEDVKAVHVPEDVIGTAADEDGVALAGYGADYLALDFEEDIVIHVSAVQVSQPPGREETGNGEKAALLLSGKDAFGEALFFCGFGNQFVVIERNAQFFADSLPHIASSAAEAAADVDDSVHFICPPRMDGSSPSFSLESFTIRLHPMSAVMTDAMVSEMGKLYHTPASD